MCDRNTFFDNKSNVKLAQKNAKAFKKQLRIIDIPLLNAGGSHDSLRHLIFPIRGANLFDSFSMQQIDLQHDTGELYGSI